MSQLWLCFPQSIPRALVMMGGQTQPVDCVPCGNVCGVMGVDKYLLKTGTLSTYDQAHNMKVRLLLLIYHWSYTSGESRHRVCVCLSVRTHISVTAGRNFLILGIRLSSQIQRQKCLFLK